MHNKNIMQRRGVKKPFSSQSNSARINASFPHKLQLKSSTTIPTNEQRNRKYPYNSIMFLSRVSQAFGLRSVRTADDTQLQQYKVPEVSNEIDMSTKTTSSVKTSISSVDTTKKAPFDKANTTKTLRRRSSSTINEIDDLCPITGECSYIYDDYHVSSQVLGTGNYGNVRECTPRCDTSKTYAVKSIDKSKIGRFDYPRREIAFLAKLNHPGIVCLIDFYEDEDYFHIITEKLGSELFHKVIENTTLQGCFSEEYAASVMKSLLEAVAHLHSKGIVHRDIKQENILFDLQGDGIKLIDFGLSRKHKRGVDKAMRNPVGTAYYMSPELFGGRYDGGCDVWSCGVVAYIVLCG
jgi:tRNA A-37 threonylcarbamoyl transferase component Bud32